MILLTEYTPPDNPVRHGEYLTCLYENLRNPVVEEIYLFTTNDEDFPLCNDKLRVVYYKERPTFTDFFEFCNRRPGKKCLIVNADIYFDDTLKLLDNFDMDNMFIAMSRWDYVSGSIIQFNSSVSQDVWGFKSPMELPKIDFHLGTPGNDNRLVRIMADAKIKLHNPSNTVRSIHVHESKFHTYKEPIPGPYAEIKCSDLGQDSPVKFFTGFNALGQSV